MTIIEARHETGGRLTWALTVRFTNGRLTTWWWYIDHQELQRIRQQVMRLPVLLVQLGKNGGLR